MSGKWFRGEGIGVIPAKAGGVDNDIGDGMYLTDKLEVAQQYAKERAPNVTDQRVYSVTTEAAGMRILDLTKDPRWQKHIKFAVPPSDSSGQWTTIEDQLKSKTASQYKKHFDNFVNNKSNNINLNDYDAIIGIEYRSGGKQMCILYKNGKPSAVQVKLRAQFVPTGGSVVAKSPVGSLQFGGKIGRGLKIAGGTLVVVGVQILIQWLTSKLDAKRREAELKKKFETFVPTIESDVRFRKQSALVFLAAGKKAFATIRLSYSKSNFPSMSPVPSAGAEVLSSELELDYLGLEITDKDETGADGDEHGVIKDILPLAGTYDKYFHKSSYEITFSQQEIDLYQAFSKEIAWYDAQIQPSSSTTPEDLLSLSQERIKLIDKLSVALAD